jgi:hypothetical protein
MDGTQMISIVTNTSEKIKDLTAITLPNHEDYCLKHGYQYFCNDFDYTNYNQNIIDQLKSTLNVLKNSDILMVTGADTMFMNWNIKVEDLLRPEDHVLVARENSAWWPINNEVMIYRNTPQALALFQRWIDDFEIWKYYPWTLQTHLWNLIQEDQLVRDIVRVVDAKVMNQHPKDWQLGDYIVHFYGMTIENKISLAKQFQEHWGDGTATWKVKHNQERPEVL